MEETEYADMEWAKECEVGEVVTKIINGKNWDIQTINDIDDQLLRDKATKKDSSGTYIDFRIEEYKLQLLLKCVVKPKLTRGFVEELRRNKLSGNYTNLVSEVMKLSGTDISISEQDKEKNLESPTESTTSSR